MRPTITTALVTVALAAALSGCGSPRGATTGSAEGHLGPAKVQRELVREYGLDEPRCERDPRGSGRGRFACYFEDKGAELKLTVTQGVSDEKPTVIECGGAHEKAGEFLTCAIAPVH